MRDAKYRAEFALRLVAAIDSSGKSSLTDEQLLPLLARSDVVVTKQTVSNWRNGRHLPDLEQVRGLARTLAVDPGELAFGPITKRVAEQASRPYATSTEESLLIDGFVLLDEPRREVVKEVIRLLLLPPSSRKRPGRPRASRKLR